MAESFVKTFKRDYVYTNTLSDAQTVLKQLSAWFEDYNENAPHKGLKMKTPREYNLYFVLTNSHNTSFFCFNKVSLLNTFIS